jgi:hypothetical protein
MFNLGFMHEFGAGVPQDLQLAKRFYDMARHTNVGRGAGGAAQLGPAPALGFAAGIVASWLPRCL